MSSILVGWHLIKVLIDAISSRMLATSSSEFPSNFEKEVGVHTFHFGSSSAFTNPRRIYEGSALCNSQVNGSIAIILVATIVVAGFVQLGTEPVTPNGHLFCQPEMHS